MTGPSLIKLLRELVVDKEDYQIYVGEFPLLEIKVDGDSKHIVLECPETEKNLIKGESDGN